ncbi:MAG: hypothetical protein AAFQ84_06535, partial [Pseudomonadota bacterium]
MSDDTAPSDAIARWLEGYVAAFSAFDVPGICGQWAYPVTILQDGRRFSFATRDAFEANVGRLTGFYRRQGVAGARGTVAELGTVSDTVISALIAYELIDQDGACLLGWGTPYVYQRTGEGWRAVLGDATGEAAAW